ncbi:MAG TPA: hypothetical protein VNQ73_14885 [Ilumatobacter sp.]|nr:hypothetical protein [Ilumatobacter sp.]
MRAVMTLAGLGLRIGIGLVLLGVGAFVGTGAESVTALIPAVVGVVLIGCGVAGRSLARRKGADYAALVVGGVGAVGCTMNVAQFNELVAGTAERPVAVAVSSLMFLVLATFVVIGIVSLREARSN